MKISGLSIKYDTREVVDHFKFDLQRSFRVLASCAKSKHSRSKESVLACSYIDSYYFRELLTVASRAWARNSSAIGHTCKDPSPLA